MKTLTLQQGSPEWLAHRRTTRNASDASVMMGAFPTFSRREFVKLTATGFEREHSDYVQKFVLDRGHEVEPALRALAEKIIGEDLYPVTGVSDDGYLGASFDGVTLAEDVIFEAKQPSADKITLVEKDEIPPQDYWQIVQQFAVCESAQVCIYVVGDGSESNTRHMKIARSRIEADIPKLLAGWRQFEADVAAYTPEPAAAPAAVGRAPTSLPALRIELTGMVTESNLREFRDHAIGVFKGISTDLQNDQDFADAEQTVKWCKDIEERLKAAKDHALSQTASIDELFRAIDSISAEARAKRLELDKLVTRRKEEIRAEIVQRGVDAVQAHYRTINATLGEYALQAPTTVRTELAQAIKGKKTLTGLNDAVDSAVADAKIEASQTAERVRANIAVLSEVAAGFEQLFADRRALVASKEPDDLRNLVKARIAEHEQREQARLEAERDRIRAEESERLEREAKAREQQSTVPMSPTAAKPCDPNAGETTPIRPDANGRADGLPAVGGATSIQGQRIKLGDINAAIAPLAITAEGLATLGFKPVGTERSAKLYAASEFPAICAAMSRVIAEAPARARESLQRAA